MFDPLEALLPRQDGEAPQAPVDWEMWLVKNDSDYKFEIPVNDSKNPVPIIFEPHQVRQFPYHRAKWLADQLAQRITIEQWKDEEKATGRPSTKLWLTADPDYRAKFAAKLILGKEGDQPVVIDAPTATVTTDEVKQKRGAGLEKYREEQRLKKAAKI